MSGVEYALSDKIRVDPSSIMFQKGGENGMNQLFLQIANEVASQYTLTLPPEKPQTMNEIMVSDTSGNLRFTPLTAELIPTGVVTTTIADTDDDSGVASAGSLTEALSNVTNWFNRNLFDHPPNGTQDERYTIYDMSKLDPIRDDNILHKGAYATLEDIHIYWDPPKQKILSFQCQMVPAILGFRIHWKPSSQLYHDFGSVTMKTTIMDNFIRVSHILANSFITFTAESTESPSNQPLFFHSDIEYIEKFCKSPTREDVLYPIECGQGIDKKMMTFLPSGNTPLLHADFSSKQIPWDTAQSSRNETDSQYIHTIESHHHPGLYYDVLYLTHESKTYYIVQYPHPQVVQISALDLLHFNSNSGDDVLFVNEAYAKEAVSSYQPVYWTITKSTTSRPSNERQFGSSIVLFGVIDDAYATNKALDVDTYYTNTKVYSTNIYDHFAEGHKTAGFRNQYNEKLNWTRLQLATQHPLPPPPTLIFSDTYDSYGYTYEEYFANSKVPLEQRKVPTLALTANIIPPPQLTPTEYSVSVTLTGEKSSASAYDATGSFTSKVTTEPIEFTITQPLNVSRFQMNVVNDILGESAPSTDGPYLGDVALDPLSQYNGVSDQTTPRPYVIPGYQYSIDVSSVIVSTQGEIATYDMATASPPTCVALPPRPLLESHQIGYEELQSLFPDTVYHNSGDVTKNIVNLRGTIIGNGNIMNQSLFYRTIDLPTFPTMDKAPFLANILSSMEQYRNLGVDESPTTQAPALGSFKASIQKNQATIVQTPSEGDKPARIYGFGTTKQDTDDSNYEGFTETGTNTNEFVYGEDIIIQLHTDEDAYEHAYTNIVNADEKRPFILENGNAANDEQVHALHGFYKVFRSQFKYAFIDGRLVPSSHGYHLALEYCPEGTDNVYSQTAAIFLDTLSLRPRLHPIESSMFLSSYDYDVDTGVLTDITTSTSLRMLHGITNLSNESHLNIVFDIEGLASYMFRGDKKLLEFTFMNQGDTFSSLHEDYPTIPVTLDHITGFATLEHADIQLYHRPSRSATSSSFTVMQNITQDSSNLTLNQLAPSSLHTRASCIMIRIRSMYDFLQTHLTDSEHVPQVFDSLMVGVKMYNIKGDPIVVSSPGDEKGTGYIKHVQTPITLTLPTIDRTFTLATLGHSPDPEFSETPSMIQLDYRTQHALVSLEATAIDPTDIDVSGTTPQYHTTGSDTIVYGVPLSTTVFDTSGSALQYVNGSHNALLLSHISSIDTMNTDPAHEKRLVSLTHPADSLYDSTQPSPTGTQQFFAGKYMTLSAKEAILQSTHASMYNTNESQRFMM